MQLTRENFLPLTGWWLVLSFFFNLFQWEPFSRWWSCTWTLAATSTPSSSAPSSTRTPWSTPLTCIYQGLPLSLDVVLSFSQPEDGAPWRGGVEDGFEENAGADEPQGVLVGPRLPLLPGAEDEGDERGGEGEQPWHNIFLKTVHQMFYVFEYKNKKGELYL